MGWPYDEDDGLRDRVVTLTVGQLTDAIAKALDVVEDAPPEPRWRRGDRAFVEVEVTGASNGYVNVVPYGPRRKHSFALPADSIVGA